MYLISSITQTCAACPSQWEGKTTNDEDVYIRFRHGCLRMDINGETVFEKDIDDDDYNSYIDLYSALAHIGSVQLTDECNKVYNSIESW